MKRKIVTTIAHVITIVARIDAVTVTVQVGTTEDAIILTTDAEATTHETNHLIIEIATMARALHQKRSQIIPLTKHKRLKLNPLQALPLARQVQTQTLKH